MSELASWVPDGDPCPKHSKEVSRLIFLPGWGYISQCTRCIAEFHVWHSANMKAKSILNIVLPLAPKREGPQLTLIGES